MSAQRTRLCVEFRHVTALCYLDDCNENVRGNGPVNHVKQGVINYHTGGRGVLADLLTGWH